MKFCFGEAVLVPVFVDDENHTDLTDSVAQERFELLRDGKVVDVRDDVDHFVFDCRSCCKLVARQRRRLRVRGCASNS